MIKYNDKIRKISDKLFTDKVYPIVCKFVPDLRGSLLNIDASEYKPVDANNCLDFIVTKRHKASVGIAARVQTILYNYRSFTITYSKANGLPSALYKLKESIHSGLYPKWTIHAYTNSTGDLQESDEISEIGIIETIELLNIIKCDTAGIVNRKPKGDKSERFIYINFDEILPESRFKHIVI